MFIPTSPLLPSGVSGDSMVLWANHDKAMCCLITFSWSILFGKNTIEQWHVLGPLCFGEKEELETMKQANAPGVPQHEPPNNESLPEELG